MGFYRGYESARSCTGSATPGAKALMSYWLGRYGAVGAINTGIYNCRDVRGGGSLSIHGEGRACDLGVRPLSGRYGGEFAELLRVNSLELGIQLIIWNRRYWSGTDPNGGWKSYRGQSAHTDHIHAELTWQSARNLTVERIRNILRNEEEMANFTDKHRNSYGGDVTYEFQLNHMDRALNETLDAVHHGTERVNQTAEELVKYELLRREDSKAIIGLLGEIRDSLAGLRPPTS